MKHYTREELELYRNGKMSVLGRITCASHLKECEKCAGLLKELKEDDKLLACLRDSLQIYRELQPGKMECSASSI